MSSAPPCIAEGELQAWNRSRFLWAMCEGYSNPRSFHLSSPVLPSLFSCWCWPARADILFYRMLRLKSAMQPEKGGGQGKRFVMTELGWRGGWFSVLPQKSWDHSPTCHRLTTVSRMSHPFRLPDPWGRDCLLHNANISQQTRTLILHGNSPLLQGK